MLRGDCCSHRRPSIVVVRPTIRPLFIPRRWGDAAAVVTVVVSSDGVSRDLVVECSAATPKGGHFIIWRSFRLRLTVHQRAESNPPLPDCSSCPSTITPPARRPPRAAASSASSSLLTTPSFTRSHSRLSPRILHLSHLSCMRVASNNPPAAYHPSRRRRGPQPSSSRWSTPHPSSGGGARLPANRPRAPA